MKFKISTYGIKVKKSTKVVLIVYNVDVYDKTGCFPFIFLLPSDSVFCEGRLPQSPHSSQGVPGEATESIMEDD